MELVNIEGEKNPRILLKPYIYAFIKEYDKFYIVDNGKEIKVVKKGDKR